MSSPTEIKAQAIALLALGHPCRWVERELCRQFPGAKIPHFTTIARWLREMPPSGGKAALNRWWVVLDLAGEIMHERLDEIERMPILDVAKLGAKAADIRLALEQSRALAAVADTAT